MTDVFISYSRKDKAFVQRLHEALTADKRDSWVDWEDIPRAADWLDEIFRGIDAADTFVFVVSPDSLASEVCNEEAAYALRQRKRIIPLVYRDADEKELVGEWFNKTWEQQARDNWTAIKHLNWLFFRESDDFGKEFRELLKAMDTDLAYIKAHTRLLVRAKEWDANQRNAAYVLRGDDLLQAENWLAAGAAKEPKPTELHAEYVVASQKVREEERQRQRNLLQARLGLVLAVALIAVLGFIFISLRSSEQSSSNATLAVQSTAVQQQASTAVAAQATSDRRADEAQSLLWANAAQQQYQQNDPSRGLSLALEANRIPNPPALARRVLAAISYNGRIRQQISSLPAGSRFLALQPGGKTALRFDCGSSSGDGNCPEGTVDIIDILTAQTVASLDGVFTNYGPVAVYSPDGKTILLNSPSGSLTGLGLFDAQTGKLIRALNHTPPPITMLYISPDGKTALAVESPVGADSMIAMTNFLFWDIETGASLQTFTAPADLEPEQSSGHAVAFSPDEKMLAVGLESDQTANEKLLLLDTQTGDIIKRLQPSEHAIDSVIFTPDGKTVITGSGVGDIEQWDIASGRVLRQTQVTGIILALALSADGQMLLTGSGDTDTTLWAIAPNNVGFPEIQRFVGHHNWVNQVVFGADEKTVISTSYNNDLIVWDVESGGEVSHVDDHETAYNGKAVFSSDGHLALTVGVGYTADGQSDYSGNALISLWDTTTGSKIQHFDGQTGILNAAALSPDNQRVLTGGNDLALWDVTTGQAIWQHPVSAGKIEAVTFSPDGRTALVGVAGITMLIDTATGDEIRRFANSAQSVFSLAFSPDGRMALVSSGDSISGHNGKLVLWDVETAQEIRHFDTAEQTMLAAAFSPDGKTILAGNCDEYGSKGSCIGGKAVLWDVATGKELQRFTDSDQMISSIAFSSDGHFAVFGGGDGYNYYHISVIVWDIVSGEEVRRFDASTGPLVGLSFSPDGHSIFSASVDGRLTVWRLDTLDQLIQWTYANRYVADLSCTDRKTYSIQPLCDDSGAYPSRTPFPTWTPSPMPTVTAMLDLSQQTATPTPSITPTSVNLPDLQVFTPTPDS